MRPAKRTIAILLAILTLITLCACGKKNGTEDVNDPAKDTVKDSARPTIAPEETEQPTEDPAIYELTDERRERIDELAEAFALYGEFNTSNGLSLRRLADMAFALYSLKLEESEIAGYGKVSAAEARSEIAKLFGFKELTMMFPKQNDDEEQDYYLDGDTLYIRLTDPEDVKVSVRSVEKLPKGSSGLSAFRAMAEVDVKGEDPCVLVLEFAPGENGGLIATRCEKHYDR